MSRLRLGWELTTVLSIVGTAEQIEADNPADGIELDVETDHYAIQLLVTPVKDLTFDLGYDSYQTDTATVIRRPHDFGVEPSLYSEEGEALFGGLTWKHDRLVQSALESLGYRCAALPTPNVAAFQIGREFGNNGQCNPTYFTVGNLITHLQKLEAGGLSRREIIDGYVFFTAGACGPCRFGMYNKYQRMVLDSLPRLQALKISSLTNTDNYSPEGLIDPQKVQRFRKTACLAMVVADVLDRLTWRVRPYEKAGGLTDALAEQGLHRLMEVVERTGAENPFDPVVGELEKILAAGQTIIDPAIPPKPLIGMVGEIFLRMHRRSNQDLIRLMERYGAEVVNASMAEWLNYVSYDGLRQAKRKLRLGLRLGLVPILPEVLNIFGAIQ